MKIVLTGGAGFVGSHMLNCLRNTLPAKLVTIDSLSYSGSLDRLRDIQCMPNGDGMVCLTKNLCEPIEGGFADELKDADFLIHMAAQSHVDNSIADPASCAHNNVMSTVRLLDFVRKHSPKTRFIHFSTDEVFGPCPEGASPFVENDRHQPKNPYAASKSAAEQFVTAYINTYGIKAIILRSMNIFGERQHVEKFVPKTIRAVLAGESMTIHAAPDGKPGSRFWIHASNVAHAVLFIMQKWNSCKVNSGESFNIVGEREIDNLQMAQMVAKALDKELNYSLVDYHSSRPGHDLRYGMSGEKLALLGWVSPIHIEQSLDYTVKWTAARPRWLRG